MDQAYQRAVANMDQRQPCNQQGTEPLFKTAAMHPKTRDICTLGLMARRAIAEKTRKPPETPEPVQVDQWGQTDADPDQFDNVL